MIGNFYTLTTGQAALAIALHDSPHDASAAQVELCPLNEAALNDFSVAISSSAQQTPLYAQADRIHMVDAKTLGAPTGHLDAALLEAVLRARVQFYARAHYQLKHAAPRAQPFTPGQPIPYGGRVFDEREVANLIDASLDFWLTSGRFTQAFEKALPELLGTRHCLLVNSGSSANLVAFGALTSPLLGERRIQKGDEVITVAAGFPATITPIIQYGAVPVFLDVTLPTYNIDVSQLEAALSERTRAVMVAHTLGNPFDIGAVKAFCRKHDLWLIEDNCDALGATYEYEGVWQHTGTLGDIGTSSFYPPHHLTMGEGGAVYMKSGKLKRIAASLRDWGRDCWCDSGCDNTCGKRFAWQQGALPSGYDHKYTYSHFGYNLKATDMQAAIGCKQLEKLPAFIKARNRNWSLLREGLADLEERLILPEATAYSRPSWFGFLLTVRPESGLSRDGMVRFLESQGVQTRMLFAGNFLRQPCFDEMRSSGQGFRVIGDLRCTDTIMNHTFWVGVYPGLSEAMITHMIATLKKAAQQRTLNVL